MGDRATDRKQNGERGARHKNTGPLHKIDIFVKLKVSRNKRVRAEYYRLRVGDDERIIFRTPCCEGVLVDE